jgi:Sulfatase-modifying factor enzyme 1
LQFDVPRARKVLQDLGSDGHARRAPAGCYPSNGYDLLDMTGNVWEWTISPPRATDAVENSQPRGVIRGGSFLCSPRYCLRFRPAARQFQEMGLGTNHLGVRLVRSFQTSSKPTAKTKDLGSNAPILKSIQGRCLQFLNFGFRFLDLILRCQFSNIVPEI